MEIKNKEGKVIFTVEGNSLVNANLQDAYLQDANLDFSCFPLWCGSLNMKIDKRIAIQLAYHFCRLVCNDEETKEMQSKLKDYANKFHRVYECGKL